jgi:hypothetical protein
MLRETSAVVVNIFMQREPQRSHTLVHAHTHLSLITAKHSAKALSLDVSVTSSRPSMMRMDN